MRRVQKRGLLAVTPVLLSVALVLSACGGSGADETAAQNAVPGATAEGANAVVPDATALAPAVSQVEGAAPTTPDRGTGVVPAPVTAPGAGAAPINASDKPAAKGADKSAATGSGKPAQGKATGGLTSIDNAAGIAANQQIAAQKNGATDIGVTNDSIKMGTVGMKGMALGNLLITPIISGIKATFTSINDRGGILGRRLSLVDCDDGPGEVSRSKACIKKLQAQDKIFALLAYSSWASASVHSDLAQYKLPAVGVWGYSQTEWQDPYMFPTHMSLVHEAMAGAHWVKNVIKPKTYGLICLSSPEMQLSCNEAQQILDASGAKLVKKVDVGITETSMASQILAMRSANPEHILHFVINPATVAKFMTEAAQQGYYPSKGISGNHLAAEILGSLFGKHPVDRYWTNTTFKLWGSEFMSVMNKYARGNKGLNHHIVQASYVGALIFEQAAKAVGPNLTRERLIAQLSNGDVYSADSSLDQRFSYTKAERGGTGTDQTWSNQQGQGREYMYKYTSTNTTADPNGAPSGFQPDPDQFVIYTSK